jgi:hypothetical protein
MENNPDSVRSPVTIHRFPGFAELYADTGIPEVEAPKAKEKLRFTAAVYDMDDTDLHNIREYDRAKYGGFNGS